MNRSGDRPTRWQFNRKADNLARLFAWAVAITSSTAVPALAHGITEQASIGPRGIQSDGYSEGAAISSTGRFVAFSSDAYNLVRGETSPWQQVYVRDRKRGITERVSVGPGGVLADSETHDAVISADGRFVAFSSRAANLVPDDSNMSEDIFVHDRKMGTTERISLGSSGRQGNNFSFRAAISSDGRFVAFYSYATNLVSGDTNRSEDVFVRDRKTGNTQRVSVGPGEVQGNGASSGPAISADGRYVAFSSAATNLVSGDTNGVVDVFLRDRKLKTTDRLSQLPGGIQGNSYSWEPAISSDGQFIAFSSAASNLVPSDTNDVWDVFVHDRKAGRTWRVSVSSDGKQSDSIQGNGNARPAISGDGRFVAFYSDSNNLVPRDTNYTSDILLHDCKRRTTRRVSVGPHGIQANSYSTNVAISADGHFVAFDSDASNLVFSDTNGAWDVFVRTLMP